MDTNTNHLETDKNFILLLKALSELRCLMILNFAIMAILARSFHLI